MSLTKFGYVRTMPAIDKTLFIRNVNGVLMCEAGILAHRHFGYRQLSQLSRNIRTRWSNFLIEGLDFRVSSSPEDHLLYRNLCSQLHIRPSIALGKKILWVTYDGMEKIVDSRTTPVTPPLPLSSPHTTHTSPHAPQKFPVVALSHFEALTLIQNSAAKRGDWDMVRWTEKVALQALGIEVASETAVLCQAPEDPPRVDSFGDLIDNIRGVL